MHSFSCCSQMPWSPSPVLQKEPVCTKPTVQTAGIPLQCSAGTEGRGGVVLGEAVHCRQHPALFSAPEQLHAAEQRRVWASSNCTHSQQLVLGKPHGTKHWSTHRFSLVLIMSWTSEALMRLIPCAVHQGRENSWVRMFCVRGVLISCF